tara:strand:+ start:30 stop:389 length:360 start_codon:yes stop_codon:yes gene_type:complete
MKPSITIDTPDELVSLVAITPNTGKTKYIAVTKTWHDKINGNTYWSSCVEDIEKDVCYRFPFQYGYGDHSEYVIKEALKITHDETKFVKIENCKKREVEKHGKGAEDSFFPDLGYYYQD